MVTAGGAKERVLWRSRKKYRFRIMPFGGGRGRQTPKQKSRERGGETNAARQYYVARREPDAISIELVFDKSNDDEDDDGTGTDTDTAKEKQSAAVEEEEVVQRIPLKKIPRRLRDDWPFGSSSSSGRA